MQPFRVRKIAQVMRMLPKRIRGKLPHSRGGNLMDYIYAFVCTVLVS